MRWRHRDELSADRDGGVDLVADASPQLVRAGAVRVSQVGVPVALRKPRAHIPASPDTVRSPRFDRAAGAEHPDLKGLPMTPQFLRSEAARFRDMAESSEREASRQRLLAMAVDYEAQAEQGEKLQPPEPIQAAEPEPASEGEIEPEPGVTSSPSRLRLSRTAGPRRGI